MKLPVFRMAPIAALVVLVALVAISISTPAGAHAILVSSTPKNDSVLTIPPKTMVLRFDSNIEKKVSQVTLFDSKNKKIALPAPPKGYTKGPSNQLIIPMPKLKPGTYRLEYKILATDGHLTPGLIRFTISGKKSP